jgi:1-acyl-sn-glycerol-3-phosphate acyltransferase
MASSYTLLDDSLRAWRSNAAVLKDQGNYLDRSLGYFVSRKVLQRFGVQLYVKGLEKLPSPEDMAGRRILLLPNHRSYLDPVIVHHVLGCSGFRQPRVVALDFLAATPLAPIFKKCGAVFIKGSFKDLEYREKMNETLRNFADKGDWVSFFPEGMRSLSGKQMDPRRGLLAGLTTDSPCVIYPINISYTRLIEDREFISKRRGFNVKHTLSSLFLPSQGAGPVYFTVGDPIYTGSGADPRETASNVTRGIMQENLVHTTDLLCTILLERQEAMDYGELEREVQWLTAALQHRGVPCTPLDLPQALLLLKHCVSTKHGTVSIRDKTLLIYYRNRMLYTIGDLVSLPDLLRKEVLWSPPSRPRMRDAKRLKELAKRAFEPTVFLYKYLSDKIQEGETSVKELRRSLEDNPHCCYELLDNFLNVLKENGAVRVEGDTVILI